jgi:crotonobetainyl-CoA:carnitine CoA-transferase CaiB-like acyl-CoA transferase
VNRRDVVNEELAASLAQHSVEHWTNQLREHAVPVAPVRTLGEVYASPQTQALGMIDTVSHPELGELEQIGFPVTFNGRRPRLRNAPPTLGQHSREVLASLGYDDEAISALLQSGAP